MDSSRVPSIADPILARSISYPQRVIFQCFLFHASESEGNDSRILSDPRGWHERWMDSTLPQLRLLPYPRFPSDPNLSQTRPIVKGRREPDLLDRIRKDTRYEKEAFRSVTDLRYVLPRPGGSLEPDRKERSRTKAQGDIDACEEGNHAISTPSLLAAIGTRKRMTVFLCPVEHRDDKDRCSLSMHPKGQAGMASPDLSSGSRIDTNSPFNSYF